jgi:hypothetical protein
LIVTLPLTVAVSVTEHFPEDRVQVFEENVTLPVPETFDQVMVPVWDAYPPDTVAVQVIFVPTAKDDLMHVSAVCEDAFVMVSLAVPEDGELYLSPR